MQLPIIVIVEHFAGQIRPVTYELVSFAKKLQQGEKSPVRAIILDEEPEKLAREVAAVAGLDVTAVRIPGLVSYNGEIYKTVLADLLGKFEAACVCIAHSSQGMDFAPALAVALKAACITAVEDIVAENHCTCFVRSIFSGKAVAHVRPQLGISILTIQPGMFRPYKPDNAVCGRVEIESIKCKSLKSHATGVKQAEADTTGITEAGVIVSAGHGLGDKENLDLVYRLAALFTKSAVGGSRIACDLGWLAYKCQVGVTGATVSPKLYIACGISGAVQHVSGMRNSEFIVAINKDPAAAIFQIADVCIVEDLTTFIPTLIEAYEKSQSGGLQEFS